MLPRLTLLLCAAALAAGVNAGTLEKIKENKSITLGHRESSIPFSYYDNDQKVIGYSQDLMMKAVEAIRAKSGVTNLKVRMMPITSANRIPLVMNGTVDMECGSTTNNTERQKQVAFSTSIFVVSLRMLTAKDSGIKDFPDLAGKNVATTAGTTSERMLRKMNAEKNMDMRIISAKDHGEAFLMVETGRASAFVMDDALLYGELAKARDPGKWIVTGKPQGFEAYGCMMRKGDPAFKAVVDEALAESMRSGEAAKLYRQWFESSIPPKELNLNFPLPEAVKELYAHPNDKAFQ